MKKSLLALALLGAFAGSAQAQSSVQIYGNLDLGVTKRTDVATGIGKRANNTLGFKGTEELGNGLKALFQLEIRYEPDTGTLDFCFIASVPLEQVIETLKKHQVVIIEGPCIKTGAMGQIRSVYFRDPDLNLVEVSEYV